MVMGWFAHFIVAALVNAVVCVIFVYSVNFDCTFLWSLLYWLVFRGYFLSFFLFCLLVHSWLVFLFFSFRLIWFVFFEHHTDFCFFFFLTGLSLWDILLKVCVLFCLSVHRELHHGLGYFGKCCHFRCLWYFFKTIFISTSSYFTLLFMQKNCKKFHYKVHYKKNNNILSFWSCKSLECCQNINFYDSLENYFENIAKVMISEKCSS